METCLNKRLQDVWLLPGCHVRQLRNPHEKPCVVGSIFEALTADVLGGSRLNTDSTFDCCPDVVKPFTLIESKASCQTCFVIHADQMVKYRTVWAEHIQSVWFALWRYRGVKGLPKTDVFTEQVVAGVEDLWLVDFPVVERLVGLAPKMFYIRAREGKIGYHRVGIKALAGLFDDPAGFAGPGFRVKTEQRTAKCSIDGIGYMTPPFRVVSVLDEIPF